MPHSRRRECNPRSNAGEENLILEILRLRSALWPTSAPPRMTTIGGRRCRSISRTSPGAEFAEIAEVARKVRDQFPLIPQFPQGVTDKRTTRQWRIPIRRGLAVNRGKVRFHRMWKPADQRSALPGPPLRLHLRCSVQKATPPTSSPPRSHSASPARRRRSSLGSRRRSA